MASTLDRFETTVGDAVERAVAAHHSRRLQKAGWGRALNPGDSGIWASGDPVPREANALEVLVDGSEALPRIETELERAEKCVLVAGWHFTPAFQLRPDGPTLRQLLAGLAERIDVRVLAWGRGATAALQALATRRSRHA